MYELCTVTYGTSPASFLATRCLTWLAEHYAGDWPNGSKSSHRTGKANLTITLAAGHRLGRVGSAGASRAVEVLELKTQLNDINRLNIPRCIKHATSSDSIQVHVFCDASQRAYGACVWSVFVSHRVGEIQNYINPENWHHVKSTDNSADLLSRGLDPQELTNSRMWWHGPSFLHLNPSLWPDSGFTRSLENIPEQRRFFKSRRSSEPTIFVSHQEILAALRIMCKSIQRQAFFAEYKDLQEGRTPHTTSSVLALSPFICSDGLIRVGEQEHERNAHAGAQATMAAVRQRFWPISLRSATRKVIRNCVTCFRSKPVQSETIMASLPAGRVNASRSFMHCGVDYAGPFILRESKRRNACTHKAYLAVFVCFSTKCVHLELVSDLTAEAFIAALKRFVSRRGKPSCIYSDNGTTFVGAHGQLKELFNILRDDQTQVEIANSLREHETTWKFIPPVVPVARWSQEYLHTLQERSKWRTNKGDQLKPNQMVLLKQPNLAPLQWLLGRVEQVHPGTDGNVRTATIRTAKSLFTRPLTKLAILPIETQRSTSF
ncbi:PREDICTED: uncharacterized protein LOC108779145 [Cyphomyrmex costatus]|uniref:uncharacterized protein LOC108779145 n=1 Tax=Cyphomyrmex costatus TaxID=456900 RepID=UPI0008522EA2|nr:PREDICTED: uncharacterized protein LOC108779145 [Cyphomyrmex costatus]